MDQLYCKYCSKSIKGNYFPTHYRLCENYKNFIETVSLKLTREFLEEEYLVNRKSVSDIHKELHIEKKGLVVKYLNLYGIKRRSRKESAQSPRRQLHTKNTCMKKYGIEHHLSHPDIIKKREDTIQQLYKVQNIFQSQEIKDKIKRTCLDRFGVEFASQSEVIKNKVKSTNLKRSGYDNPWKNPIIIKRMMEKKSANGTFGKQYSKSSQRFFWKIYSQLPEELKSQVYFAELNKEFGKKTDDGYYYFDFVIPTINYCLEYNGTYFHADPLKYQADWVNKKLKLTAAEIWDNDSKKIALIESYGFRTEIVWQAEDEMQALNRVLASIVSLQTLSNI